MLVYGVLGILGAMIGEIFKWREIPKSLVKSNQLSSLLISKLFLGFLFGITIQLMIDTKILDSILFESETGRVIASLIAGYSENLVIRGLRRVEDVS